MHSFIDWQMCKHYAGCYALTPPLQVPDTPTQSPADGRTEHFHTNTTCVRYSQSQHTVGKYTLTPSVHPPSPQHTHFHTYTTGTKQQHPTYSLAHGRTMNLNNSNTGSRYTHTAPSSKQLPPPPPRHPDLHTPRERPRRVTVPPTLGNISH